MVGCEGVCAVVAERCRASAGCDRSRFEHAAASGSRGLLDGCRIRPIHHPKAALPRCADGIRLGNHHVHLLVALAIEEHDVQRRTVQGALADLDRHVLYVPMRREAGATSLRCQPGSVHGHLGSLRRQLVSDRWLLPYGTATGELRDRRGGELRDREPLKPGELRDR